MSLNACSGSKGLSTNLQRQGVSVNKIKVSGMSPANVLLIIMRHCPKGLVCDNLAIQPNPDDSLSLLIVYR